MPGYGEEAPVSTDMGEWVSRILECGDGLHVIAHSYGGLAAILSAVIAPQQVRSLTLFEPAAYAYARGMPKTEAFISRMAPIVERAAETTAAEYHVAFLTALTGSVPPQPVDAVELRAAERNRLLDAPWNYNLPIEVLQRVPTLVLSGGWSDDYEEIATAMASGGARHLVLGGYGHRVQDHPEANPAIACWILSNS